MNIGDWAFGDCAKLIRVGCRGNPPVLAGNNVFSGDTATVYYLSGATGWGTKFGGRPALLWNPVVPYDYTTNNDSIKITRYTGSGGAVVIPGSINLLPVTSIGDSAFYNATNLTGVTIPNSVTNIDGAFVGCTSLTQVTIPNSVTSFGGGVFADCSSLTNIVIPNSVANIGESTFYFCGLTQILIPDTDTNLGR